MLSAANIMTSILGVVRTMVIETWFSQDVKKPVQVHYIDGNVFSQDNNGNKVGVVLTDGDTPVNAAGTISANVIRSDGTTVAVTGSSSNNTAWVVLPQSAYAVPGLISIIIKSTESSVVTTLCAVVGNVYQSTTDTVVDPGTVIPSIQTLINEIDTAVASIPADYSSLWTKLAPAFSSSSSYTAGQYVTYDGGFYRFLSDHSGTWDANHVISVSTGSSLQNITDYLNRVNDVIGGEVGVYPVIRWVVGRAIVVNSGTTVDISAYVKNSGYQSAIVPCVAGDKFYVKASGVSSTYRPWTFTDSNYTILSQAGSNTVDTTITAPTNAAYLIANARYGASYSNTLNFTNSKIDRIYTELSGAITDLDTELSGAITELDTELSGDITSLDTRLTTQIGLLQEDTGFIPYQWIAGYKIATNGSTVDPTALVTDSNYHYLVVDCSAGDEFRIVTPGANSSYRPWTFIDSSGNKLSQAASNITDTTIIAPTSSAKLVCNSTGSTYRLTKITNGFVTPQLFGAKGDGVTDDTAAFQRAIDSGYAVYVPSSKGEVYLITDTLDISRYACPKIYGDAIYTKPGKSKIIFDLNVNYSSASQSTLLSKALFNVVDMQLFRMSGLSFDCASVNGGKVGILIRALKDTLVDYDIDVDSCYIADFSRVVAFQGRGFTVTNSTIASCQRIGYFDWDDSKDTNTSHPAEYDQRAIRFQNNRIHHTISGGVQIRTGHAYGFVFSGNVLDNGSGYLITATDEAYNWNVTGNLFQGIDVNSPVIELQGGARNCIFNSNTFSSDLTYWGTVTPPTNWISSGGTFEYCTIVGNNFKNCTGSGISVNNANNNVISGNICQGVGVNSETATPVIYATGAFENNCIVGNNCTGTSVTLIDVGSSGSLSGNQIYANIPNA